jgi:arylsulfatase A-like enzyme
VSSRLSAFAVASLETVLLFAFAGCSQQAEKPAAPEIKQTTPAPAPTIEAAAARDVPLIPAGTKPNVIWILLDACRAQNLSCYGYERETSPNLDALAKDGVLFERNYSQASTTTLSLPSYLTGKYFPVACITGNWAQMNWRQLFRTPPENEKIITEIMRENGYEAAIVTAHPWFGPETRLAKSVEKHHCIYVPAPGQGHAHFDDMNREVFKFLEQPRDRPFFLYMHTMDTHFPHFVREGHDMWIDRAHAGNPPPTQPMSAKKPESEADKALLRGLYDGGIHYADAGVKVLLDKLEALGMRENTLIVISADHGECLGETLDGGEIIVEHPPQYNFEELVHTPLIMAGPGLPKGKRVSGLTQNCDIVPTIVAALGLTTNAAFDGNSLVPLMKDGGPEMVAEYAVGRWPRGEDDYLHYISVRDTKYRYEFHPHYNSGELWQYPDHVEKHLKATDPAVEQKMRAYIEQNVLPQWDTYLTLPRATPRVFSLAIAPKQAIPSDGFAWDSTDTDNKWQLQPNIMRSVSTKEDCPPVQFKFEVPNGLYHVMIELRPMDFGSAVQIKAEGDESFKPIESSATNKLREFAEAGIYDIQDDAFDVAINDLDKRYNAEVISFLFVPIVNGEELDYSEDLAERNNQLEAIGYGGQNANPEAMAPPAPVAVK